MADRIILLPRGDEASAQQIIDEFEQRTGLERNEIDGGTEFEIGPDDHGVQVVQTLTDIDPEWTDHLELGDPQGEPE